MVCSQFYYRRYTCRHCIASAERDVPRRLPFKTSCESLTALWYFLIQELVFYIFFTASKVYDALVCVHIACTVVDVRPICFERSTILTF